MYEVYCTDQLKQLHCISGVIQNSRDTAFHQEPNMQGEIL